MDGQHLDLNLDGISNDGHQECHDRIMVHKVVKGEREDDGNRPLDSSIKLIIWQERRNSGGLKR